MSPKEDAAPKPSPAEASRLALTCEAELPPVLRPRGPPLPLLLSYAVRGTGWRNEAGHALRSGWSGPCAPRDVGGSLYSVGPTSLLGTENLGLSVK